MVTRWSKVTQTKARTKAPLMLHVIFLYIGLSYIALAENAETFLFHELPECDEKVAPFVLIVD